MTRELDGLRIEVVDTLRKTSKFFVVMSDYARVRLRQSLVHQCSHSYGRCRFSLVGRRRHRDTTKRVLRPHGPFEEDLADTPHHFHFAHVLPRPWHCPRLRVRRATQDGSTFEIRRLLATRTSIDVGLALGRRLDDTALRRQSCAITYFPQRSGREGGRIFAWSMLDERSLVTGQGVLGKTDHRLHPQGRGRRDDSGKDGPYEFLLRRPLRHLQTHRDVGLRFP